jgi:hypothetical protein
MEDWAQRLWTTEIKITSGENTSPSGPEPRAGWHGTERLWAQTGSEKLTGAPAEETLDQQLTEKGFLGAETEQELDTSRERYEEKIQGAWMQQEEQPHTCVCLISKQIAWK